MWMEGFVTDKAPTEVFCVMTKETGCRDSWAAICYGPFARQAYGYEGGPPGTGI